MVSAITADAASNATALPGFCRERRAAGISTEPIEAPTLATYCVTFQFKSATLRMVCAENLGVAMFTNTVALDALSVAICASTVGSETS